jgi:hypothetical protein
VVQTCGGVVVKVTHEGCTESDNFLEVTLGLGREEWYTEPDIFVGLCIAGTCIQAHESESERTV